MSSRFGFDFDDIDAVDTHHCSCSCRHNFYSKMRFSPTPRPHLHHSDGRGVFGTIFARQRAPRGGATKEEEKEKEKEERLLRYV